jgi:proteasome lid subunit RPN8/RPN11
MTAGQPDSNVAAAPPFVHCVHWTPRKLVGGVSPATHADLVLSQGALKQARDHASSSPTIPVGGVLLGRLSEDPACGRRWVLVETAVPAKRPLPEDASAEILDVTLREVIRPEDEERVVGWYRTHGQTGVYLSGEEARLHESQYGEPWQFALILLGSEEHPVGGVFQQTESDGLSRSAYTPFYELADPSSELTAGAKRTFVGWSNYQTEVPVVLAGTRGVSAAIPSLDDVEPADAGPAEPASQPEPVIPPATDKAPTPGAPPATTTVPITTAPPAPERAAQRAEPDEDWSRVQIRRSLSAVGRTLGPSSAVEGTRPRPVELVDEEEADTTLPSVAADPAAKSPEPAQADQAIGGTTPQGVPPTHSTPAPGPDIGVTSQRDPAPIETRSPGRTPAQKETRPIEAQQVGRLEPVGPELSEPETLEVRSRERETPTLVGGSRRRSRVPPRMLTMAATGLISFLGGWFIVGWVKGSPSTPGGDAPPPGVAAGELPITQDPETSVAGLAIGQRPLFPRASDPSEPVDGDFMWVGPEVPEALSVGGGEAASTDGSSGGVGAVPGEFDPTDPALETAPPVTAAATTPEPLEPGGGEAVGETPTRTEPGAGGPVPTVAAPPDTSVLLNLAELRLDDPAVAAFEDAFTIFRRETIRYDSLRVAFDDQLAGCNALNLSYRAVKDSFRRLGTRFESAREQFAGPGLQAYRSAQRQITVIDVHYQLSECPLPRGG